jgi:hypothetical protein
MKNTALEIEKGYDNIDYEALEALSSTMERYFLKCELKYIKRLRAYVDIVLNHVEECAVKNNPMYFDNKYPSIHYRKYT